MHYFTAPLGARNVGWALSFGPAFFERLDPALMPLFGSFAQAPAYALSGTGFELDAAWFARLAQELAAPRPGRARRARRLFANPQTPCFPHEFR